MLLQIFSIPILIFFHIYFIDICLWLSIKRSNTTCISFISFFLCMYLYGALIFLTMTWVLLICVCLYVKKINSLENNNVLILMNNDVFLINGQLKCCWQYKIILLIIWSGIYSEQMLRIFVLFYLSVSIGTILLNILSSENSKWTIIDFVTCNSIFEKTCSWLTLSSYFISILIYKTSSSIN